MVIVKFGGTSVGSSDAIKEVISIMKEKSGAVLVVSALSGVTDTLIQCADMAAAGNELYKEKLTALWLRHLTIADDFLSGHNRQSIIDALGRTYDELQQLLNGIAIIRELSARSRDAVASFGEQFSARLIAGILSGATAPAAFLDTRNLIVTDASYGRAHIILELSYANIKKFFNNIPDPAPLYVATGFIARSVDGAVTTLGRGGSDLTAAIFAAALDAEEVEIWTDVDGILTADPRMVKNAFSIPAISYAEAMELSHFGAKVIYPPTIRPALKKGIPIRIRNTFNPTGPSTMITRNVPKSDYPIRGISSHSGVVLMRVQGSGMVGVAGFSSRLFGALARRNINIMLISQSSSEYSICFAILPQDRAEAEAVIKEEFVHEIGCGVIDEPVSQPDCTIIAVVGIRMQKSAGVSGKVFHALGRNGISVIAIAQGSSELNISAVIADYNEAKALNAIHEAFFLSTVRSVNLFLIGAGLIGGTLLEQLADQQKILEANYHIRINLAGAGDVRGMMFQPEGLDPRYVRKVLRGEVNSPEIPVEQFDLPAFIEKMKSFNLPNTAFCDCTASADLAAQYETILRASIAVVTPNKKANSGSYDYYKRLTGYSRDRGIPYLYETTVCAGLPVLSSLRDLFLSGDHVRKIEAVVSGTLSFIFNNFDGSKPFSALVREAKTKGYTEPDPRDDLNAMDAARKALILARECGIPLEFSAVSIEPILPVACFEAPDVEAFFTELEKSDADFESKRAAAESEGKSLRYVVIVEDGYASIKLRAEKPESPFRSLVDSDNIVVITTDRYSKLPMVIKGPGAGAQVTAGGVFADIVRLSRTLV
ncbi:bifunctional aspartate kinase/homoserine dehydrogenase I [Spirochaetia bacterium]|nr:bifunctional aspartate kinase/homoserine dehydrogenase I [Spirochaetia bacterium]GHU29318.1 bifunctional aspartate kinase/homoserine dehydrogenase I [Spirochaetia bacterium]